MALGHTDIITGGIVLEDLIVSYKVSFSYSS